MFFKSVTRMTYISDITFQIRFLCSGICTFILSLHVSIDRDTLWLKPKLFPMITNQLIVARNYLLAYILASGFHERVLFKVCRFVVVNLF